MKTDPVCTTFTINFAASLRILPGNYGDGDTVPIIAETRSVTIPIIDGTPVQGTYTNDNGDKITLEAIGDE